MRAVKRLGVLATVASLALVACDVDGGEQRRDAREGRPGCGRAVPGQLDLRYAVESAPTAPGTFEEALSALCARFARLGLEGSVRVARAGSGLSVHAPRSLRADVEAATGQAKLAFYDWEPNVLAPPDVNVPFSGPTALFEAAEAAARAVPRAEPTDLVPDGPATAEEADVRNDTSPGPSYYLFGADRRPIAGPAWNPGTLAAARRDAAPGARVLKVPRGVVVVEAERPPGEGSGAARRYLVLEDDAELTRADVANPRAAADAVTRRPVLAMDFTNRGRALFARLTRRIAERSAASAAPSGTDADASLRRFAISLDDRVVTLPLEGPEGLDGRSGAQIGGVGTPGQARRLALLLRSRPLPAHLAPIARGR